MLKKNKKQPLFHSVADDTVEVYDFRLRSTVMGFESYRTLEYSLYYKLEEEYMIPRIDEHLEKLFAGDVDEANGNTLDEYIFGSIREATPDLKRQKYNHYYTLERLIFRRDTDRDDIKAIIERHEKVTDMLQADYDKICSLLEKCEEV